MLDCNLQELFSIFQTYHLILFNTKVLEHDGTQVVHRSKGPIFVGNQSGMVNYNQTWVVVDRGSLDAPVADPQSDS